VVAASSQPSLRDEGAVAARSSPALKDRAKLKRRCATQFAA
jgi:hypothetical protein